ncbi:Imm7 family immunity protein [Ancylobacter terrae]|uniref:Imm7 family immunity protein n=1 Tax=Ancylobacter sp. sgz301288 TaxID=3342077 RepID=UPI003858E8CD
MFQYHMWLVSGLGEKLGHEPCTDDEYAPFEEREEELLAELAVKIEDCIFRELTHNQIRTAPAGFADADTSIVRRGLRFQRTYELVTCLNFERNHVPTNILGRQRRLMEEIYRLAPATFGVAYLFSEDEPPFNGRFHVFKMVKDKIFEGSDPFFDACFPVVPPGA